jgi:CHAD domain-containing protein
VKPKVVPKRQATDPTVAVLRQLHANLTITMLRVERNPTMAAVHDVRVAARRLRSLFRAYRGELHPILYAGLQFDLRNLGRTLGPLREASVRRQLVRSMRRSTGTATEPLAGQSMKALLAGLGEAERRLQTDLREAVRSAVWNERTQRIDDALSSSALVAVARQPAQDPGRRALQRRVARVLKYLADSKTSPRALHRLRLAVKKARYLAEVLCAAPGTLGAPKASQLPDLLRKLQNSLGDINDHYGLLAWIAAASLEPAVNRALAHEVELRIDIRLTRFRKQRKSVRSKLSEDPLLRLEQQQSSAGTGRAKTRTRKSAR